MSMSARKNNTLTIFSLNKDIHFPYKLLVFLYFSTTCAEMLNIHLIIFKFKLNFIIGSFMFFITLISGRLIILKSYFTSFLILFLSVALSSLNSYNPTASAGFLFFFLFTYAVYTTIPISLQQHNLHLTLSIYSWTFIFLGVFSLAQVLFSFIGIYLPFVTQKIGTLARGQAWTYEPSYFALYMTPFISFENSLHFLTREKKWARIFFYNILFLSSTSTGCFFTYLFLIIVLAYFLRKNEPKKWKKLIIKMSALFFSFFIMIGVFFPKGFIMLFKFFIGGHGASSFWIRWDCLVRCWEIFLNHPFLGVGLGGISTYISEKYLGLTLDPLDPEILLISPPTNVSTEILASLGIPGIIAFTYLFYLIYRDFRKTLRIPLLSKEERINVQAFAVSLCATIFTYQFNQSIMRSYIWVHIAICIGYLHFMRKKYSEIRHIGKDSTSQNSQNLTERGIDFDPQILP